VGKGRHIAATRHLRFTATCHAILFGLAPKTLRGVLRANWVAYEVDVSISTERANVGSRRRIHEELRFGREKSQISIPRPARFTPIYQSGVVRIAKIAKALIPSFPRLSKFQPKPTEACFRGIF
jgi:hypothetical protein